MGKINTKQYLILSVFNFGAFVYLVLNKDLLALVVFPLILINQASLYFVGKGLVESAAKGGNLQKNMMLIGLKILSLVAIVLVLKQFKESFIAIIVVFLIQTVIFISSLKSGKNS